MPDQDNDNSRLRLDKTMKLDPSEITPSEFGPDDGKQESGSRMKELTSLLTESYLELVSSISHTSSTETFEFDVSSPDVNAGPVDFGPDGPEAASENLDNLDRHFEVKDELAKGGQAEINIALDKVFNRLVAVKSINRELNERPDRRRAFLTEAKVTAQLDHPAIIPVYGLYDDDAHGLHLAMKLIRGKNLKEYLRQTCERYGKMKPSRIIAAERQLLWKRIEIFLRVCEAISYVHHRQVIHRDLKPENIMMGRFNETYVMDWGIAEYRNPDGSSSGYPGKIAGTLQYIAPEVINKQRYDYRSDIFLLGLILFEITFLKPAYTKAATKEEAVHKAQVCRFDTFEHRFGCKVDQSLVMIIAKALAPRPKNRYLTVGDLEDDLRNFRRGEAVSARPENIFDQALRLVRNHSRMLLFFSLVTLLLFAIVSVFSLYRELDHRETEERQNRALASIYSSGLGSCAKFDRIFKNYEYLITSISREAALLLEGEPKILDEKLYTIDEGRNPATAPPDFVTAPTYGKSLALSTPVYIIPGGEITPVIRRTMELLYPLRRSLAATLYQSLADIMGQAPDPISREEIIRNRIKPPLLVAYAGFEVGVHIGFPFETDYPEDYDPRQRGWYRDALENPERPYWGEPYIDTGDIRDIVITCSYPIRDRDQRIIGVSAADVSLSRLIDMLTRTGNTGNFILRKNLISRDGLVIADSTENIESIRSDDSLDFKKFPQERLLETMWRHENGWLFNQENGRNILYFYFHIESLNWLYIEQIDFNLLLSRPAVGS